MSQMIRALPFKISLKEARAELTRWGNGLYITTRAYQTALLTADKTATTIVPTFVPFYKFSFSCKVKYSGKLGTTENKTTKYEYVTDQKASGWYQKEDLVQYGSLLFYKKHLESFGAASVTNSLEDLPNTLQQFPNLKIPAPGSVEYDEIVEKTPSSILNIDWHNTKLDSNQIYAVESPLLSASEMYDKFLVSDTLTSKLNEYAKDDMKRKFKKFSGSSYDSYEVTYVCPVESSRSNIELLYLPIYIALVRVKGEVYKVYISGETGQVVGSYPYSMPKVFVAGTVLSELAGEVFQAMGENNTYELFSNMPATSFFAAIAGATAAFISREYSRPETPAVEYLNMKDKLQPPRLSRQEEQEIRARLSSSGSHIQTPQKQQEPIPVDFVFERQTSKQQQPLPSAAESTRVTKLATEQPKNEPAVQEDTSPKNDFEAFMADINKKIEAEKARLEQASAHVALEEPMLTTSSLALKEEDMKPTVEIRDEWSRFDKIPDEREFKVPEIDWGTTPSSVFDGSTTAWSSSDISTGPDVMECSELQQEIQAGTDFYTILGLNPTERDSYGYSDFRDKYMVLEAQFKQMDETRKQSIKEAYQVLSDGSKKYFYDQFGKQYVRNLYKI